MSLTYPSAKKPTLDELDKWVAEQVAAIAGSRNGVVYDYYARYRVDYANIQGWGTDKPDLVEGATAVEVEVVLRNEW